MMGRYEKGRSIVGEGLAKTTIIINRQIHTRDREICGNCAGESLIECCTIYKAQ